MVNEINLYIWSQMYKLISFFVFSNLNEGTQYQEMRLVK